ncbi:MAG: hypothetical protein JW728_07455 [Candidatus Aureabacteria bacterium]|nr:hypothetical protein [Candidatus Auribacterota bacterium]
MALIHIKNSLFKSAFFQVVFAAAVCFCTLVFPGGGIPAEFEGFKLGMTLDEVRQKLDGNNLAYNQTVDPGMPNALKEGPPMSLQSELARALKYTMPLALTVVKLGDSEFAKFYFTGALKPEKLCIINVRYGSSHWQNYSTLVEDEAKRAPDYRKESEEGFMKRSQNDSAVWEDTGYIYKITRATEQDHFSMYGRKKMRSIEGSYLELLFVDKALFEKELSSYR